MKYILLVIISTFFLPGSEALAQSDEYYTTTTIIIEKADLVGDNEIDTGIYTILKYSRSYDIPNVTDEEHERFIFIKMKRIEDLILHTTYNLPDSNILVSEYFWSPWSYSETKKISGTVTRTRNLDTIQEFDLHLHYIDKNDKTDTLLYGVYQFRKDVNYFSNHKIEYNGEYHNLRIALKEPDKVRKLDLSYGGVWKYQKNSSGKRELPAEIGRLKNLEELNLTLQELKYLPPEFSQLKNLKILDISYNQFKSFPIEVFSCENLDSLNLTLSYIKEVPSGISRLKSLKKLILDDNSLDGFPLAVTDLPELRELSITNGNILSIPREIEKLTKLEKLNFGNFWNYSRKNVCNNLENLSRLSNLRELDLEWTKIKYLPSEFSQLKKLEVLNIKYNDFRSFPEVIDQIPNLKLLIICHEEFDKRTMRELKKQNKKYKIQVDTN